MKAAAPKPWHGHSSDSLIAPVRHGLPPPVMSGPLEVLRLEAPAGP